MFISIEDMMTLMMNSSNFLGTLCGYIIVPCYFYQAIALLSDPMF